MLAVIDSSEKRSRRVIRKTARMATHINTSFVVLYVQGDREAADRIPLANQRYLINNLNLATELGGEIRRVHSNRPVEAILETCREQKNQYRLRRAARIFIIFAAEERDRAA